MAAQRRRSRTGSRTPASSASWRTTGSVAYRGTYTAFDGAQIAPQMIETADFRTLPDVASWPAPPPRTRAWRCSPPDRRPLRRAVALGPREQHRRHVRRPAGGATPAHTLHTPVAPGSSSSSGNCGSPIETAAGWLVLTHGVGPMREYAIGALLLDLRRPDPGHRRLREPLLCPTEDERDGYVPNVVYSCGGAPARRPAAAALRLQRLLDPVRLRGPACPSRPAHRLTPGVRSARLVG